ncbi:MAG TPA: LytTR family DNA-binding domain-containing protein [Vicinamibacterales bacterium]
MQTDKARPAAARPEWGVLIADDEPAARRGVRQLLAAHPEFAVVGECRDGKEVLSALDSARPHVVFLDVQMPGIDGFEVIRRRTPERMPAVVFLTAYDQFAIRAFEAQALDYLLKPASEERFAATVARLKRRLTAESVSGSPRDRCLVVPTARGAAVVPVGEIEWIGAEGNYARIWTGGRSYLLREPLRLLEQRIGPEGFMRAHRRALVRLSSVRALAPVRHGELLAELVSGAQIPVSRRRRAAFAAAVRSQES